ncbi:MAG: hypothetical protein HY044_04350 [Candidatus Woesebacteria bacterium]|nr:MAG: hypothetical protein HY044_04350 [Candidatus Woesebacteria bacterium]
MSFLESEIALIHSNTSVHEGRKTFGQFDSLIPNYTNTELFPVTDERTQTAIIIPVMEREGKLNVFFERLTRAVVASGIPTSLVVMDNSLTDKMIREFEERSQRLKGTPVTSILYHHDARMTQTTLRNHAVTNFLPSESENVGLWDSDIYSSVQTLQKLMQTWGLSSVNGIAPPLVGYKAGEIDEILKQYEKIRVDPEIRKRTHMPGAIGEENGVWAGDILRTTMMRGAFLVKKDFLQKIARENPNNSPWLEDFVVWQNVPFFLAAREIGLDFGYVMTSDAIVAHDDNIDELSVGYSLPYRRSETLKSLVMLMHRNKIYSPESRDINSRFLRFNLDAISRICGFDKNQAGEFQEILVEVANMINNSNDSGEFNDKWQTRKVSIKSDYLGFADEVVNKLAQDEVFQRVKSLHSSDLTHAMYSI